MLNMLNTMKNYEYGETMNIMKIAETMKPDAPGQKLMKHEKHET